MEFTNVPCAEGGARGEILDTSGLVPDDTEHGRRLLGVGVTTAAVATSGAIRLMLLNRTAAKAQAARRSWAQAGPVRLGLSRWPDRRFDRTPLLAECRQASTDVAGQQRYTDRYDRHSVSLGWTAL